MRSIKQTTLRLVLMSDSHELHREVIVPPADILICAGDWTMRSRSQVSIDDFGSWLQEQPIRLARILVAGNHESYLLDGGKKYTEKTVATLFGEVCIVAGLKIWGSPVTQHVDTFGVPDTEARHRHYDGIPPDTDVVVTHGPPYGILDCDPDSKEHSGCKELLRAVERIRPRLHVFGHVHRGHGIQQTGETTFVNASLLGADGDIAYEPILVEMRQQKNAAKKEA